MRRRKADLARDGPSPQGPLVELPALALAYFLASTCVFVAAVAADDGDNASPVSCIAPAALLLAFIAMSVGVGYGAGRWAALWFVGVVWLGAVAADVLAFGAGIPDRSGEYEPFPVAFVIVVWLPWFLPAVGILIATGVLLARARRRRKARNRLAP